jgi:hypothetical protein
MTCGKLALPQFCGLPYFRSMKMHIAAIGFNERELEMYVSQLQTQGFESLSDVKKAEDGSFYRVMAKMSKFEAPVQEKASLQMTDLVAS